jgi:hypothetical protein
MAAYRTRVMEPAEKQLQTFDAMSELRQYYLMLQLLVEIERGSERYDDHEMCREKFCKSNVLCQTYYVCFAPNQQSMVSMAKLPTTLLRKHKSDGHSCPVTWLCLLRHSLFVPSDLRQSR